jgi:hypothetical protein
MVSARSKAWPIFARSSTAVVGSYPTRGMDVCVRFFCVCFFVLCVDGGLATDWSHVQWVLPSVKKDLKTENESRAQERAVEPMMNNIFKWKIESASLG